MVVGVVAQVLRSLVVDAAVVVDSTVVVVRSVVVAPAEDFDFFPVLALGFYTVCLVMNLCYNDLQ